MTTFTAKAHDFRHGWLVVAAQGKILGRLAAQIAARLRGKHKPEYTPHVDTGDYVVVLNASKIRVTGRKAEKKKYYSHTGFPGAVREITFAKLHAAHPERVLACPVRIALPRADPGHRTRRERRARTGREHPHSAQ